MPSASNGRILERKCRDGPLVDANLQQRPLTMRGEVLQRVEVVEQVVYSVCHGGVDVFVGADGRVLP